MEGAKETWATETKQPLVSRIGAGDQLDHEQEEALVSHTNAALTPRARLRLAKLTVEEHWPVAVTAKMFMTSPPTARQ